MSTAVTVIVELDLTNPKKALPEKDDADALFFVQQCVKILQPNEPAIYANQKRTLIVDLPNGLSALSTLIHYCNLRGYSYTTDWRLAR